MNKTTQSKMKFSSHACVIIIAILLFQPMGACAKGNPSSYGPSPGARVTIPYTEGKQLDLPATRHSYALYIRLPDGYIRDQTRNYPVLYLLDTQWDFKMLDAIYGGLLHDGFIPEIIIVGVTCVSDNPDYAALRSMDFTPVHDVILKGSSDAREFNTFLKTCPLDQS